MDVPLPGRGYVTCPFYDLLQTLKSGAEPLREIKRQRDKLHEQYFRGLQSETTREFWRGRLKPLDDAIAAEERRIRPILDTRLPTIQDRVKVIVEFLRDGSKSIQQCEVELGMLEEIFGAVGRDPYRTIQEDHERGLFAKARSEIHGAQQTADGCKSSAWRQGIYRGREAERRWIRRKIDDDRMLAAGRHTEKSYWAARDDTREIMNDILEFEDGALPSKRYADPGMQELAKEYTAGRAAGMKIIRDLIDRDEREYFAANKPGMMA